MELLGSSVAQGRVGSLLSDAENGVICVYSSVCELTSLPRFSHVSTSLSTILCTLFTPFQICLNIFFNVFYNFRKYNWEFWFIKILILNKINRSIILAFRGNFEERRTRLMLLTKTKNQLFPACKELIYLFVIFTIDGRYNKRMGVYTSF